MMSVKVRVPTVLRPDVGGQAVVAGEGDTVADVISHLDHAHPGFAALLLEGDGGLKPFVNVFVDEEDVRYLDGLETEVGDGSEIVILPAVAGG